MARYPMPRPQGAFASFIGSDGLQASHIPGLDDLEYDLSVFWLRWTQLLAVSAVIQ
jgi:hypothetical protein